jgi:hypothetical protein
MNPLLPVIAVVIDDVRANDELMELDEVPNKEPVIPFVTLNDPDKDVEPVIVKDPEIRISLLELLLKALIILKICSALIMLLGAILEVLIVLIIILIYIIL